MASGTKITEKGQVTIPVDIRESLKLFPGESVIFELKGDTAILKKAVKNPVENMVGLGKNILEDSVAYPRKLREEWKRRKT